MAGGDDTDASTDSRVLSAVASASKASSTIRERDRRSTGLLVRHRREPSPSGRTGYDEKNLEQPEPRPSARWRPCARAAHSSHPLRRRCRGRYRRARQRTSRTCSIPCCSPGRREAALREDYEPTCSIPSGDFIVVERQQTARDGEIVVAGSSASRGDREALLSPRVANHSEAGELVDGADGLRLERSRRLRARHLSTASLLVDWRCWTIQARRARSKPVPSLDAALHATIAGGAREGLRRQIAAGGPEP